LARRYKGYEGPFCRQINEDLAHPVRRPLLIETLKEIPDTEAEALKYFKEDFPLFLLRALDILGIKLLHGLGWKADGIYNIPKPEKQSVPLEQRPVKHTFVMDDGTIVKVV